MSKEKKTVEEINETEKRNFWGKAVDAGKKVAVNVQTTAHNLGEKAKSDGYTRRMKKYNPLFPQEFFSENFKLPNMIVIVDDAVRKDIDVCEGAIGWLGKESSIEILYLYDEAVELSKIQFIPSADCDSAYYVDNFDRKKFKRVDCIFSKAHEEKIAELNHIAFSLGAKSCAIEIVESSSSIDSRHTKTKSESSGVIYGKNVHSNSYTGESYDMKSSNSRSGKTVMFFEGEREPIVPTLKWFAHDDNIKGLIDMRCSGEKKVKTMKLELYGSSFATLSQSNAYAIDNALSKFGSKASFDMEKQATRESKSKLIVEIEF